MSEEQQAQSADAPVVQDAQGEDSFISELFEATKKNYEEDQVKKWKDLVVDSIAENATSNKIIQEITAEIERIDAVLTEEVNRIMHHPKFQKLEGTWRGLSYLVANSITGPDLRINCFNLDKEELIDEARKTNKFQKSELFKKIYLNRYAMPGGTPYSAVVGDYSWSHAADDVTAVSLMAQICSAAHAPFLTSPSTDMFGISDWSDLKDISDEAVALRFDDESIKEMTAWRSFRKSENSRYVTMTMPRVLARLPYGKGDSEMTVSKFDYQELEIGDDGMPLETEPGNYCWMNSAFTLATRMTNAFRDHGWAVNIRGPEAGGKVENLPVHVFKSKKGDTDVQCPTESPIDMHKEGALGRAGFMPLAYHVNTDYAAFFGAQTTHKPTVYDDADANASENLHSRLSYIMAISRVAHLMNVMARNMIGQSKEREEVEKHLDRWLKQFVLLGGGSEEAKAEKPFAEASVQVKEDEDDPGVYFVKAQLRPHFQVEALQTSLSLVAKVKDGN